MILPVIYQLCIGVLTADVLPFISLLLLNDGYEMKTIGLILSIANIGAFISSFILSYVGVKENTPFWVYLIYSLSSIFFLILYWEFPLKYLTISGYYLFFSPIVAFLDNYTLGYIDRDKYPPYRAFASVGWGLTAALISYFLIFWKLIELILSYIFVTFSFRF